MKNSFEHSTRLFESAKQCIPGGVNSPVRAFQSVGGVPRFISRAKGAYLYDADGNRYIDYINSWGPMILGHGHPAVVDAIRERAKSCISFGTPTELEIEMAQCIQEMVQNVALIRLVNSGTEACMSAVRLARGYTGRDKIIKFEGCYHGHADCFLVKAGSGVATLGIEKVPGITAGVSEDTLIAPYNQPEALKSLAQKHKGEIAAIIVEPVGGNMGCILPEPGFLETLREVSTREGIVLIFDEVMTGFRLAPGGAQERFQISADLVTFGKIIGGGMPVGAFGGKKEIMQHIAPLGKVYQAGTLSGNPVTVSAGLATLQTLRAHPEIYEKLEVLGTRLTAGMHEALENKGIPHTINRVGSMLSLHFGSHRVIDFETASQCDIPLFVRFFHHLLKNGIHLPPSAFESWFLSSALSDADLDHTLAIIRKF